jgi:hypothetical protein
MTTATRKIMTRIEPFHSLPEMKSWLTRAGIKDKERILYSIDPNDVHKTTVQISPKKYATLLRRHQKRKRLLLVPLQTDMVDRYGFNVKPVEDD